MISQGHDEHSTDEKGIFLTSPGVEVSTATLTGSLKSLGPVKVETVSQTSFEPLWDHLVKEHHSLSYHNLLGWRLKYLAFIGEHRTICSPLFGMCEHMAASHSIAGKTLMDFPSLDA
jgi:hypothetical protein